MIQPRHFLLLAGLSLVALVVWLPSQGAKSLHSPPATISQFLGMYPEADAFLEFTKGEEQFLQAYLPMHSLATESPAYIYNARGALAGSTYDSGNDPEWNLKWGGRIAERSLSRELASVWVISTGLANTPLQQTGGGVTSKGTRDY